jgi:GDPmannose 4,6-dehydratase
MLWVQWGRTELPQNCLEFRDEYCLFAAQGGGLKMKRALITGITGQDGAYLAAFLLQKGYEVYGAYRRTANTDFWRLRFLSIQDHERLKLVEIDVTDLASCIRVLQDAEPDEVYNLAAQSFVGVSFAQPIATAEISGLGAVNLLEAIRIVDRRIRFYQASTSEMFGLVQETPQRETTPFYPRSPYAAAKLYAHWMTINYRESYGIFASSGILFNHESPLRGIEFVTRKITNAVASIHNGSKSLLELGNMDARRDWGFAGDFVDGMHRILNAERPDTYVLATGKTWTVRHFVDLCFRQVGITIAWSGTGVEETGKCEKTGQLLVKVNPKYYRPTEVDLLIGDPSKALKDLKWAASMSLDELVATMIKAELSYHLPRQEAGRGV